MSSTDIREITDYHNQVRAALGVAPLTWSGALADYAQQWTDHLATSGCRMRHRQPNAYGENLFQGTSGHYRAVDAAVAWSGEARLYRGGILTEDNWHPSGHYTQMVWRSTRQLGCGEATCEGWLIVACNYDPPGNFIGRAPY